MLWVKWQAINACRSQMYSDNLGEIFYVDAHKYLKQKCSSEHFQNLDFKYFEKLF